VPLRVLHEHYGAPRDVLQLIDWPPESPVEGEVVVRMEAAAMHIADLRTIEGDETFRYPLPRTPGFEGVGRVIRVGPGVTGFTEGDRVFPALGSGTFRHEVRCLAERCMPAPEGDAVQLSLLTVNGPTALVLLEDFARLSPGDWLIQNAANSSCGRYIVQLAKSRGVKTVNVVRREAMFDDLQALGADVVLLDGADLGIDAVAGSATQRIAECLTADAPLVCYGAMSQQACEIDFYLMFRRGIVLHGLSFVRQLMKRSPLAVRELYAELAAQMAAGTLTARIAATYALEDIVVACERAAQSGAERDGKVVITFE